MTGPERAGGWSAFGRPLSTAPEGAAAAVAPPPGRNPVPAPDLDPGLDPSLALALPSSSAVAAVLSPRFPGQDRGTGVVLYGTAAGGLCAHWRLTADDLERGGGSFPDAGARAMPVVRLCRVRPEGGSESVDEAALSAVVRAGSGESAFQVAADHGRYRAELGLTNADGGWLMLARSNDLDNVSPVGVALVRRDPTRQQTPGPAGPAVPPPSPPVAVPPSPAADPTETPEPALGLAPEGSPGDAPLTEGFPLAAVRTPAQAAPAHGLDPEAQALPPARPEDRPAGSTPASTATQRTLEGRSVRLPQPGVTGAGPDAPAPAAPVVLGPLATLTYGESPGVAAGVQVEAELRIVGQAAPGSLIDLFGHPFRVGPGGRFQLAVRVNDPSLLRLALELNPPPELTMTRDL